MWSDRCQLHGGPVSDGCQIYVSFMEVLLVRVIRLCQLYGGPTSEGGQIDVSFMEVLLVRVVILIL